MATVDTSAGGKSVTTVLDGSSNTSITGAKPSNVVSGDLMLAFLGCHSSLNPGSVTPPAGWTALQNSFGGSGSFRIHTWMGYKVAGGSEPADYTWTIGADGKDDTLIIQRVTGFDSGGPIIASAIDFDELSATPASPSVTATDNQTLLASVFGKNGSVFTGASAPTGMTTIELGASRANSSGINRGLAYQQVSSGATGAKTWPAFTLFAQYTTTMSVIVSSGAAGPSVLSITNPASDSITITLSEAAATVDTINITYGGVTQSQSYTTGDDTTFTIASLTRNLLPPTGTTTVTLLAGVTEITSTTTVLDDIPGWETTDLVSPVTTEGSVFYNHTGATPVTGDKVRHNDPGNTTISATGILTQTTPRTVTVEAWDDSDETYGSLGTFTYSAGGGLSIIKSGIITQGLITSGLIQ